MLSVNKLRKHDVKTVLNLFNSILFVNSLKRDSQVLHDFSDKYSEYIDDIQNEIKGETWLTILEASRYSHVSEEKMKEWEGHFDSIVDLSSIDTIRFVPKQL